MLESWAQPYCQQPQTDEVARTFRSGGPAAPGLPARAGFVGLITARAARAYSPGANLTRPWLSGMTTGAVATGQTVMSVQCDCHPAHADMRADYWRTETKTCGDTDGRVVHF
jgi:hypothetical protein